MTPEERTEIQDAVRDLIPNCDRNHGQLTSALARQEKAFAVLAETVANVANDSRDRTDVLFRKVDRHEERLTDVEGDVREIRTANLPPRVSVLETWQAKVIGGAIALGVVLNLVFTIWRELR